MINKAITIDILNKSAANSMSEYLGIEFTEVGIDYICAKMPVDHRTKQPFGLLHGGASVVLAETLGSVGASLCIDSQTHYCVGLDINSNHVRAVKEGFVYGKATPLHVGKSTQVWEIKILNEEDKLLNISRLTVAVIRKKED